MKLIDADLLKSTEQIGKVFNCECDELYGILQLIDEQPTVEIPQWIPCSERLPGKCRDVFQVTVIRIQDNYKWVQSMLWNVDEWKWWEEDEEKIDAEYYTVIAWQPLPQPYKGEQL